MSILFDGLENSLNFCLCLIRKRSHESLQRKSFATTGNILQARASGSSRKMSYAVVPVRLYGFG